MNLSAMKTKSLAGFLFLSAFALCAGPAAADSAPAKPADQPELTLVVIDPLSRTSSAYTDFDRLDLAFRYVAEQRHWPVKIAAERLAANTPAHNLELRVFLQRIRQETPGEYVFRSWMILIDHGTKHDFGVIVYRYRPRPGENVDDLLDRVFRGAAGEAAGKIEPILFPNLQKPKS